MRLKNGEIHIAREPLEKLMEQKFPVKVSLGLAKLANKLRGELAVIDAVRDGLITKYGEPAEDNPSQITVKPGTETFAKFAAEYNELMEQEVEVVFDTVALPETVDGAALMIEPSILMALEKFVTLGESTPVSANGTGPILMNTAPLESV